MPSCSARGPTPGSRASGADRRPPSSLGATGARLWRVRPAVEGGLMFVLLDEIITVRISDRRDELREARPMGSRLRLSGVRCATLGVMSALTMVLSGPRTAQAAVGDVVAAVEFDTACPKGIGVGIAFDGVNLWFSCTVFGDQVLEGANDLYRATTAGVVTASYKINTDDDRGIGALAYDAGRNGIWVGWGNAGGGPSVGNVYFVSLDAAKNVVGSAVVGNLASEPGLLVCRLDDGLAYDGLTDDLYFSDDCSMTIHHYDVISGAVPTVGAHLDDFPWGGTGCYNRGL